MFNTKFSRYNIGNKKEVYGEKYSVNLFLVHCFNIDFILLIV